MSVLNGCYDILNINENASAYMIHDAFYKHYAKHTQEVINAYNFALELSTYHTFCFDKNTLKMYELVKLNRMTDIPTDAKLTNLELTQNLFINESLVIDQDVNISCNTLTCSKIFCDDVQNLSDNTRSFDMDFREPSHTSNTGLNNSFSMDEQSYIMGGTLNECYGKNSVVLGGEANEISGNNSVIVGGSDNQCMGNLSVCAGMNSLVEHDNSFVWNSKDDFASSTNNAQFVISAKNGTFVHLPSSNTVWDEHIEEGMACFCWDPIQNAVCLKTKQGNRSYKTNFNTISNELRTSFTVDDGHINIDIINPDKS